MTTWEEIRDEVAGMLADGKPLEDVISKLEKRKNEMAKANLIAVMDEMKKPKPMTNEEWLRNATTEQLADVLWEKINGAFNSGYACCNLKQDKDYISRYKRFKEWLKQPHHEKE